MKYIILILLFSSLDVIASECGESNLVDSSLLQVVGRSCLSQEISKNSLKLELAKKSDTKNFCNNCKNRIAELTLTSPEIKANKKDMLAKATLNELQKEITFLSSDLMKLRSSYAINMESNSAVSSCSFSNIKVSCLDKKKQDELQLTLKKMQNQLATELANMLTDTPDLNGGLLTRQSDDKKQNNKCEFKDKDIIDAKTRYNERLLTRDLISRLKALNIPPGKDIDTVAKEMKLSATWKSEFESLKDHPFIHSLLNDTTELNNFLNTIDLNSMAPNAMSERDANKLIVEKLYHSKTAENYGSEVQRRCETTFQKTSQYLENIYCKDVDYVAEDFNSMQAMNGKAFNDMSDDEAEKSLQLLCTQLNTQSKSSISFDTISNSLNSKNPKALTSLPLEDFKKDTFRILIDNKKISICAAKDCADTDMSPDCQMYKYINQTKTSPEYKQLASASSDNINQILRSLIGSGIPSDPKQVALLQKEGILPGAQSSQRPQQQDVGTFHRSLGNITTPTAPQQSPTAPMQTQPEQRPSAMPMPSYVQPSLPEAGAAPTTIASPSRTATPAPQAAKFSNLSDKEQQELIDRMMRAKQASDKSAVKPASVTGPESETAFAEAPSYTAEQAGTTSAAAPETRIIGAGLSQGTGLGSGPKAVLDPKKQENKFNAALLDANKRVAPADATAVDTAAPALTISKSNGEGNEIKIKAEDANVAKVNEFNEELNKILKGASIDLSKGIQEGEKFVVKLNKYEINVSLNKATNKYEASCQDPSVPSDYLKTIAGYFNKTLSEGPGKREALINTLKSSTPQR